MVSVPRITTQRYLVTATFVIPQMQRLSMSPWPRCLALCLRLSGTRERFELGAHVPIEAAEAYAGGAPSSRGFRDGEHLAVEGRQAPRLVRQEQLHGIEHRQ